MTKDDEPAVDHTWHTPAWTRVASTAFTASHGGLAPSTLAILNYNALDAKAMADAKKPIRQEALTGGHKGATLLKTKGTANKVYVSHTGAAVKKDRFRCPDYTYAKTVPHTGPVTVAPGQMRVLTHYENPKIMSGKCGMYPMRPCWDKDDYNKCRNNYDHHAHDDVHCDCDDKKKKGSGCDCHGHSDSNGNTSTQAMVSQQQQPMPPQVQYVMYAPPCYPMPCHPMMAGQPMRVHHHHHYGPGPSMPDGTYNGSHSYHPPTPVRSAFDERNRHTWVRTGVWHGPHGVSSDGRQW